MRLAVVASETTLFPVLEALDGLDSVSVVAGWSSEESVREKLKTGFPHIELVSGWDRILVRGGLDAVLVAGAEEEVLTVARLCTQAGLPVLVLTDFSGGPAKLFEAAAACRDAAAPVRPIFVSGMHAPAAAALDAFQRADFGDLWRIEFERTLGREEPRGLNPLEVDRLLFQDLEWLRRAAGTFTHVTLLPSGEAAEGPLEVTVTLSGREAREAHWLLREGERPGWRLTLRGARGELTAHSSEPGEWRLESGGEILATGEDPLAEDLARQLDFCSGDDGDAAGTGWPDVVQLAEIGAAARRSQARKRTIEVHFEEASERNQFKSQMTALGCGVLLWTLFGAIFLLTMAAIGDPRDREHRAASAAGFVLKERHFAPGERRLTPDGVAQLDRVAREWSSTSPVLIVEAAAAEDLNERRFQQVVQLLREREVRDPQARTVVRSLTGKWFVRGMWIGWGTLFLPLGLYLAAQLLILAAKQEP